jgi:hypothetical protein
MSLLAKRKPVAEPTNVARDELEQAVKEASAATALRDSAIAAEGPAREAVYAAELALKVAQEALAAAKADAAGNAADALLGNVVALPANLKQARAAVMEAEDNLEFAVAARDALNARRFGKDGAASSNSFKLDNAVDAFIRVEAAHVAEKLAADVVRLQRELAEKGEQLRWLANIGALPVIKEVGGMHGKVADDEVRHAIYRLDMPPSHWGDLHQLSAAAVQAWKDWRIALRTDASAELPKP